MDSFAFRTPGLSLNGRAPASVAVDRASSVRTATMALPSHPAGVLSTASSNGGAGGSSPSTPTPASTAAHALRGGAAAAAAAAAALEERKATQSTQAQHFRRYELMVEFTSLRNPRHCPPGVYMMPGLDDMMTWYGVCFIDSGYYRDAVFKFKLAIPDDYPNRCPAVTFITDVFHPLVDPNGRFSLRSRFPRWEPHRDHIFHVLRYVRDAFRRSSLDRLEESQCPNREALQMYKEEPSLFAKLAQQCSNISTKDSILYDNYPETNSIRFVRLTDVKQEEAKKRMLESVPSTDRAAHNSFKEMLRSMQSMDVNLKQ